MNLDDVSAEMAQVLGEVEGLRVHDHRAKSVTPPAVLVPLPVITYDQTYGRGMDRHEYDLLLVVGAWAARLSTTLVGAYAAGAGPSSIKAALEGHAWAACDSVTVSGVEFAPVEIAGTQYMGAVFATVVTGTGSS